MLGLNGAVYRVQADPHKTSSVLMPNSNAMAVTVETSERITIAERSNFTSYRGRLIALAVAQLVLLFCIPLWIAGKEIESLIFGLLWILGTSWFCGAQRSVVIDVNARTIRYYRRVFCLTVSQRLFSILDGDSIYLKLQLDSDDFRGIHRLYLIHSDQDFYLIDLAADSPKQSQETISLVQSIANRLQIHNHGYR